MFIVTFTLIRCLIVQRPKDCKCISYLFPQMRHFLFQMLQKTDKSVTTIYKHVTFLLFKYLFNNYINHLLTFNN